MVVAAVCSFHLRDNTGGAVGNKTETLMSILQSKIRPKIPEKKRSQDTNDVA